MTPRLETKKVSSVGESNTGLYISLGALGVSLAVAYILFREFKQNKSSRQETSEHIQNLKTQIDNMNAKLTVALENANQMRKLPQNQHRQFMTTPMGASTQVPFTPPNFMPSGGSPEQKQAEVVTDPNKVSTKKNPTLSAAAPEGIEVFLQSQKNNPPTQVSNSKSIDIDLTPTIEEGSDSDSDSEVEIPRSVAPKKQKK